MKKKFFIILAVAILVVVVVRLMVFLLITIPDNGQLPYFLQGDRILVHRCAYEVRMPFSSHRHHVSVPKHGDWVALQTPDSGRLCVNNILACPGDTIWMGQHGRIKTSKDYTNGCIWPLIVPAAGTHVQTSPWNQNLYAYIINQHEGEEAVVKEDTLFVNGEATTIYRFKQNYYWTFSGNEKCLPDSRTFGFVPEKNILGQATTLLYSIDSEKPWYHSLRKQRFLRPVGEAL